MEKEFNDIMKMGDLKTRKRLLFDLVFFGECAYVKENNKIKYVDILELKQK